MNEYRYGFLITTFNDSQDACEMFESLKETIPAGDTYSVCVIDGGSTPDHIETLQSNIGSVIGPHLSEYSHVSFNDLSVALNAGYYKLLGYEPDGSNIEEFVKSGTASNEYIFWLHGDMKFYDTNWINKMCWVYNQLWPLIGRLGPATTNIDGGSPNIPLHGSNQCPTLFSSEMLRQLLIKNNYIYNTDYIKCGGYEDWDNGRRLLELGYGFAVCNLIDVWHKGMGNRGKRDTVYEQRYNADMYYSKWKTWEQPGFDIDSFNVASELKIKFKQQFTHRWYDKI